MKKGERRGGRKREEQGVKYMLYSGKNMIQEKTLLAAKMRHYQSMMCVSTYMYMLVGRRGGGSPPSKERILCTHSSRSGTFIASQIFETLALGAETTR